MKIKDILIIRKVDSDISRLISARLDVLLRFKNQLNNKLLKITHEDQTEN